MVERIDLGSATTKKDLLGAVWRNVYCKLPSISRSTSANIAALYKRMQAAPAVGTGKELMAAREELIYLLETYEEKAIAFANEDWSKELIRLIKNAIKECKVGKHGLGKYEILRLQDEAKGWYEQEHRS